MQSQLTTNQGVHVELPTRIAPPRSGTQLHKFLTLKQKEYETKLTDKSQPWGEENPSTAYADRQDFKDLCYKFEILSVLLESDKKVSTSELFDMANDRMEQKYGQPLDVPIFANAYQKILEHFKGTATHSGETAIRKGRPLMPPSPQSV